MGDNNDLPQFVYVEDGLGKSDLDRIDSLVTKWYNLLDGNSQGAEEKEELLSNIQKLKKSEGKRVILKYYVDSNRGDSFNRLKIDLGNFYLVNFEKREDHIAIIILKRGLAVVK